MICGVFVARLFLCQEVFLESCEGAMLLSRVSGLLCLFVSYSLAKKQYHDIPVSRRNEIIFILCLFVNLL